VHPGVVNLLEEPDDVVASLEVVLQKIASVACCHCFENETMSKAIFPQLEGALAFIL
jgi:hypothetical protein